MVINNKEANVQSRAKNFLLISPSEEICVWIIIYRLNICTTRNYF